MFRTKLVDMIYEELYNELHKKGHKDPKGRKLMKGDKDLDENIDIEVANAPQWTKDLNSAFKEGGIFHDLFGGGGDSPEAKKFERQIKFLDLQNDMSTAEKERQEADGVLALSKKGIPADKAKGVYQATLEAKKAAIQTKLLKKAINSKKFQKLSPEVQEKMTKNYEDNKKATEENFNSIADEYEKNGIKVPAAIQKNRGDSSKDAKGIKQPKAKAASKKATSTKTTSASSTSGKKIVNPKTGKKIKATTAVSYGKGHPAYADAKKALGEAINKSDAKYTMKMMFDNHGFGKALKHMKILRSGITLNMSSYMGPGKVLTKIVKDFNEVMGTKFKIDADSFQKGHVTSIDLKESYIRDADTPGYFSPWSSEYKKDKKLKKEMSATARKHGKFGGTGVPFPTEEPNEFAYMDFAKYVKKNEKKMLKFLKPLRPDAMFKAMQDLWSGWDRKANNGAFSNIKGNKFGRELALKLRKDGLLFKSTGNKITNLKEAVYDKILKAVPDSYSYKNLAADIAKMIKDEYGSHNIRPFIKELTKLLKEGKLTEASNVWKRFDAMQKLQGNIMDVEDEMRDITNDLKQLHMDMEQEAEPGGGKVADRYGREIEKKEKEYKKKKAEFKKLMKQLDKLEQF